MNGPHVWSVRLSFLVYLSLPTCLLVDSQTVEIIIFGPNWRLLDIQKSPEQQINIWKAPNLVTRPRNSSSVACRNAPVRKPRMVPVSTDWCWIFHCKDLKFLQKHPKTDPIWMVYRTNYRRRGVAWMFEDWFVLKLRVLMKILGWEDGRTEQLSENSTSTLAPRECAFVAVRSGMWVSISDEHLFQVWQCLLGVLLEPSCWCEIPS